MQEWTTVLLKHQEAHFQQSGSLGQVLGNWATCVCSSDQHNYNKNVKMLPAPEHLTARISNKEELFQSRTSVRDVCFFNWMQTGCGISSWKKRLGDGLDSLLYIASCTKKDDIMNCNSEESRQKCNNYVRLTPSVGLALCKSCFC